MKSILGSLALAVLTLTLVAGCGPAQVLGVGGGTGTGPWVDSITASPDDSALLGGTVNLAAVATARAGGALTYTWTATGGTITGNGASAVWQAPLTVGTWDATVRVNEAGGESSTLTIPLRARASLRR